LRYLLGEIGSARDGRPSIFRRPRPVADAVRDAPLTLRPDVTFHFYCSHTPCGDASIFPKDDGADGGPDAKKRKADDGDVHRTGAKCLAGETRQDPRSPGAAYHAVGAVRTKPGRGDRTLSVSCSDKLFRWHAAGVQVRYTRLFCTPTLSISFRLIDRHHGRNLPSGLWLRGGG